VVETDEDRDGVDDEVYVYVADTGNHLIRKITSAGVVPRFAGKLTNGASAEGDNNGAGLTVAEFSSPKGVAADSDGNL